MRILIIWRGAPHPFDVTTSRIFYFIKYSKKYGHDITLVYPEGVEQFQPFKYNCKIRAIKVPRIKTKKEKMLFSLLRRFSPQNVLSRDLSILDHLYFPEVQKKITELVKRERFDVIYVDRPMLFYALNHKKIPKILDIVDPVLYSRYQFYKHTRKPLARIRRMLYYHNLKVFEVPYYKKFNGSTVVCNVHKDLMRQYLPEKVFVTPLGVDLDEFRPNISEKEEFPNLVFTGTMSYYCNEDAIIYFYRKIFPIIQHEIRNIKLYVVGKNPTRIVKQFSEDESVVVTGYVSEVQPYIFNASVVIVPTRIDDGGFKIKVLEAMAMGNPIVSTSIGAKGLNVTPEENIIIADNPKEFARRVIELLNDEGLRNRIGANARKLMEEECSWEKVTAMLNTVFQKVVNER